MPQTVIAILVISLVEALIILPAHLDHALGHTLIFRFNDTGKKFKNIFSLHEIIRKKLDARLAGFIKKIYLPALAWAVKNRYFTLSLGMGVLIISMGLVAGGHVPFVFFSQG